MPNPSRITNEQVRKYNQMRYKLFAHRHADTVLETKAATEWSEIQSILENIDEEEVIQHFELKKTQKGKAAKSISKSLNAILRTAFLKAGWKKEARIFQDPAYNERRKKTFRLDFAKGGVSVEVAFNHGEAIAWNLIKPVLASELNHVKKDIQTICGVYICPTASLKNSGGYDNAVGEYEKVLRYLKPLQDLLKTPIMIVGLESFDTFELSHETEEYSGKSGKKTKVVEATIKRK